jgi:hypothetical protein
MQWSGRVPLPGHSKQEKGGQGSPPHRGRHRIGLAHGTLPPPLSRSFCGRTIIFEEKEDGKRYKGAVDVITGVP